MVSSSSFEKDEHGEFSKGRNFPLLNVPLHNRPENEVNLLISIMTDVLPCPPHSALSFSSIEEDKNFYIHGIIKMGRHAKKM